MARLEIKIAGFGGQGIITLGRLIALSAHSIGKKATETVVYGSEARGGSAWADVVIDDEEVDYPRTTQPQMLVLLSPEAAQTFAPLIRNGGIILYDPTTVKELTAPTGVRAFAIPATRIAKEELGSAVAVNSVIFGAFVELSGLFPPAVALESLQTILPPTALALNQEAFNRGLSFAQSLVKD